MKTYNRIFGVLAVLALVSSSALVVWAQDQYPDQAGPDQGQAQIQTQAPPPPDGQSPQGDPQNDPPAIAARLQFMSGSVSVQPHGTDDWVAGALNRPLTNSDNIWADKNSRAEINVGTGLIRIDSESSLTLTNVSENAVQLQLHQGAMNLHIRDLEGQTYEVDTPNQAFTVQQRGDYRFDVNPDADTTVVTVWRGEGESTGDGPAVRIHENEQARFSDGTSLKNQMHAAPEPDAFDQWAQSRDERFDHSQSARYVSPDVVGSDDLDEYGTWRDSPEYGNVWVPSGVGADWAPYRYGHWIWVAPWGWTWVEDEPWGYAPFHYGRWVYYDNYWGWAPGPYYVRPYYAPALVAWFGGGGWGIGFGFGGGYGWCPLGFGEPFIPWYGASHRYFNRVNITNTHITNITNVYNNTYRGGLHGAEPMHYANLHARNGFTAVSRDTLINSRSVARNNVRVSPNELSRVSAVRSLDVRPTRATMLGANSRRTTAMPPPRTFARPVVTRNNPGSLRGGTNMAGRIDATRSDTGRNNDRPTMGDARGVQQNMPNRGASPNSNIGMPERGGPTGPRYVPRPPSAGGITPEGRANQGQPNQGMDRGNYRPGSSQGNNPRSDVYRQPGGPMSAGNSRPATVPRPSPGYTPRSSGPDNRGSSPAPRSNERSNGPRSDMRPMNGGGYSSAGDRTTYSSSANNHSYGRQASPYEGSYSRPAPSYGGSYGRPMPSQSPSYDRGSYGRPAPSYGGGSYGRPAPSYGGGSSARSAPAYSGGGGGYSGGGRSSGSFGGGGGRSSGGYSGGGHASAPSHGSSGGGGGSHSSGGGSRGGHH